MTEEKFTKLAEEDLDLVVGGAEYKNIYIYKNEKGGYSYKSIHFKGDPATPEQLNTLLNGGSVPGLNIELFAPGKGSIKAKDLERYIELKKKDGYTVYMQ